MKKDNPISPEPGGLRRRAEERLRQASTFNQPTTKADTRRLLYELQVHQIELEMQNEELRKAREGLEASLQSYTDLYDFAPVGYFTLDREGIINQVNFAGASLLGMERARLDGRRLQLFVAAADQPAFDACLQQAFSRQTKVGCEVGLQKAGGQVCFVRMEAIVSGEKPACHLAAIDMTERKQAQAGQQHYKLLAEHLRESVLFARLRDGQILEANPAAEKAYGYRRAELLGRDIFALDASDHREAIAEQMRQANASGILFETAHRRKDGRGFPVAVSVCGVVLDGERVLLSIVRDLTERGRAESDLREGEALSPDDHNGY